MSRLGLLEINSFLILILAYCIFIAFINKKEYSNSLINSIASSTLGIYLIHDNVIMRKVMWNKINIRTIIKSKFFWLYEIEIVIGIYIACLLIDVIRKKVIEEKLIKLVEEKINIKKYTNKK